MHRRCSISVLLLMGAPVALAHDGAKFEPPDGTVLHGAGQDQIGFKSYSAALAEGESPTLPYITKEYYSLYDRASEDVFALYPDEEVPPAAVLETLAATKLAPLNDWLVLQAQGLMPEIGVSYSSRDEEGGSFVDPGALIVAGTLDIEIRALANVIKDFGDPVFVRPGFEPRPVQLDPYQAGYSAGSASYTGAYRRIVDLFRDEGVKNAAFIWCAAPLTGVAMVQAGEGPDPEPPWFPGDRYVDWIGIDVFLKGHFTEGGFGYASVSTMLDLADKWKKPVILAETSALYIGPMEIASTVAGDGDCGCPAGSCAADLWDGWFGPFFEFIALNPRIKAFAYINWDWPAHSFTEPPWADSRIENCTALVDMIRTELEHPRYLHKDTPGKFNRPWLDDLGTSVVAGQPVVVTGGNLGTWDAGDPPPTVDLYWSTRRWQNVPPTPGRVDYDLGFLLAPPVDQYLFLNPPLQSISPVPLDLDPAAGTFQFTFPTDSGSGSFSNETVWIQGHIRPVGSSTAFVTQPFQLVVD